MRTSHQPTLSPIQPYAQWSHSASWLTHNRFFALKVKQSTTKEHSKSSSNCCKSCVLREMALPNIPKLRPQPLVPPKIT